MNKTTRCHPNRNRMTLVGAVHLLLITPEENILLIRRANTGYMDGNYSVPAGHIEAGESATETMARESSEEVGINLDYRKLRLVHTMHRRSVGDDCINSERVDFFFTIDKWEGKPRNLEPHKCDDVSWHHIRCLPENVVSYVRTAIELYQISAPFSEIGWEQPCPQCGFGGR